jgi:hypothetical protein
MPECLEHVWRAFCDLAATRQSGMAPCPITYQEIEAYRRLTLSDLTSWEVSLIRRLDLAALSSAAGEAKPRPAKSNEPEQIPVTNTAGIKALFQGLAAKKRAQKGGQHG